MLSIKLYTKNLQYIGYKTRTSFISAQNKIPKLHILNNPIIALYLISLKHPNLKHSSNTPCLTRFPMDVHDPVPGTYS